MELKELLKFDDIVIQCHDNPDADALSSGYALYWYFKHHGKKVRFIYRGRNPVNKSNLRIMIDELNVPVSYEPDFSEKPKLLITVDCQYGQKNVTTTEASNVAVIDHHNFVKEPACPFEIRNKLGSCATLVWDMMKNEGITVDDEPLLSTALYYGLYTDTNHLSEVSHPLDRDMIDELSVQKSVITKMNNSNISMDELLIVGRAILKNEYDEDNKLLILKTEACDPNILGVVSDFSMETDTVDVCVAYYIRPEEVKFSVRSCIKEVHANELAAFIADGIGGGGGHIYKAGGMIRPEAIPEQGEQGIEELIDDLIRKRLQSYFDKYEIIYAEKTVLDTTDMEKYEKLPQELGVVKLTDIFPVGTTVEIRTLEGDIGVKIDENVYLMIGVEGEIYPIKKEKLEKSYILKDKPYVKEFEYRPKIKNLQTEESRTVLSFARTVLSTVSTAIYARPLTKSVKLFTAWDTEKYYSGEPGDFIAVREDDPHDIYVIRKDLFSKLYHKSTS
ncbi:nanoRNase/pAp phosphatase, hydrolyzes c-di-AMP and oligoRNAs [Lachnospiraceae bacterium]|nr:nanoRNase/pAp phosphatase, hydrolyzes c-di-AMP and oligoRNAs [Lachnospiraceae bacterium]